MLNIKDLEARHKKYKFKSYIPYIITGVSIISITIIVLFNSVYVKTKVPTKINNKNNIIQTKNKDVNKSVDINTTDTKKEILIKNNISNNKVEKNQNIEKIILSPSLDFIKSLQPHNIYTNESEYVAINKDKKTDKIDIQIKENHIEKIDTIEIKEDIPTPTIAINKKSNIKIKREKNDELTDVIKRFKVNNSPALSLFIAKKYYKSGEYRKSYNYALITNQINNNIEASWIIFAKSLMKLNEKDMAIKTLKKYIDHSHSSQAKILLDEINSGKFK